MLSFSRQNEFHLDPDSDLKVYQRLFVRRTIQTLGPPTPTILEIGAGSSDDIVNFVHFNTYAILDPEYSVQHSKTEHIQGNLGEHPCNLPSKHFDIICSVSVLEHLEHDLWQTAAEQMFQACKTDGLIIHCIDGKCTGQDGDHFDQMLLWKEFLLNAGFQFLTTPWTFNSRTVYHAPNLWSMNETGWRRWWNPPDEEWDDVGKPVSINMIMKKPRFSPRRHLYRLNRRIQTHFKV